VHFDERDMTDLPTATGESPPTSNRQMALRAFGGSFLINGLCPYLLYVYLSHRFPSGSIQPLLWASVFPVLGLIAGIARKGIVDMIALIVLFGISINIVAIFVTPSERWALAARSLNGIINASALLISALIGKPIFYYVARQFVTANEPSRIEAFDASNAADGRRTFVVITIIWAIAIYSLCALNVTLALTLAPANYLLASQITTNAVILTLIVWAIRFARTRLRNVRLRGS
jgi:hypothetical protein